VTGPVFAFDTSVVVAALLSWHEHHAEARKALENALEGTPLPVLPAHALVESFAVFTRLPPPHRLRPRDAGEMLVRSFADTVRVAASPPESSWGFIAGLADRGVAGGRAYDELILAAALGAGATHLITLDPRHFDPGRIELVVPAG